MKNITVQFWWLFAILTYSANGLENEEPLLRRRHTRKQIAQSITWQNYRRDNDIAAEVEQLLDIDEVVTMSIKNWWRPKGLFYAVKQISQPNCSAPPNSKRSTLKISDHVFFRTRGINIPTGLGQKTRELNEFEHVQRKPVVRIMMKCSCEMFNVADTENATSSDLKSICSEGKTVTLSRGVGGDHTFFVHAQKPSGSYKVIAHIYVK